MTAYITHLTQVNAVQPVLAKDDICDEHGEVLVAKGQPLHSDHAQALSSSVLHKPIEHSVALKEEFTADALYQIFNQFIYSEPQFAELYQVRDLDEKFVRCIEDFSQYPVLRQRLSVLAIQLPDVFDQSLFCAWVAVLIYAMDNRLQETLNIAFIAGLCHDLGLLDVPPDVLFKEGKLDGKEWSEMQEHPRYGAKLLRTIKGMDKDVIRAVYEHHENIDGTGYPKGKMMQQIGELGGIINMLDSVFAIYRKHFRPRNRSFNDLVPIVQMAILSRGGAHASTLLGLLKKTQPTVHCTVPEEHIPDLIEWVKAAVDQIVSFVDVTNQFRKEVGTEHREKSIFVLQNMVRHIRSTLTSSGFINEAYLRWLDQVAEEKLQFAYRELEDVLLMILEIKHHIERFNRLIAIQIENQASKKFADKVKKLQGKIADISIQSPPDILMPYVYLK